MGSGGSVAREPAATEKREWVEPPAPLRATRGESRACGGEDERDGREEEGKLRGPRWRSHGGVSFLGARKRVPRTRRGRAMSA